MGAQADHFADIRRPRIHSKCGTAHRELCRESHRSGTSPVPERITWPTRRRRARRNASSLFLAHGNDVLAELVRIGIDSGLEARGVPYFRRRIHLVVFRRWSMAAKACHPAADADGAEKGVGSTPDPFFWPELRGPAYVNSALAERQPHRMASTGTAGVITRPGPLATLWHSLPTGCERAIPTEGVNFVRI
jgi:hypothetical protein